VPPGSQRRPHTPPDLTRCVRPGPPSPEPQARQGVPGQIWRRVGADTQHPTPYTLHPTPCTLHPTPCKLHLTPYTVQPTRRVCRDKLGLEGVKDLVVCGGWHSTTYTLHPTPYNSRGLRASWFAATPPHTTRSLTPSSPRSFRHTLRVGHSVRGVGCRV